MSFLFSLFFFSFKAWSYPEMVRHGYFQCTACHVSPTGGGVMTEYGRNLSKEVLSTWSGENEQDPLHGLYHEADWLRVGGHFRAIQTYVDDPQVKRAAFFPMQMQLDAASILGKWTMAASVGVEGGRESRKQRGEWISPDHYIMYRPIETIYARAGKYIAGYGLNLVDHTSYVKGDLGLVVGRETYNVEVGWQTESVEVLMTALMGRPYYDDLSHDKGVASKFNVSLGESTRVGASVLRTDRDLEKRWLGGLDLIFGITKDLFWLSELDVQWATPHNTNERKSVLTYNRLGYEIYKGVVPFAIHQLNYADLDRIRTRKDSYGLGLQFFPRPHFDLTAEAYKERNLQTFNEYYDVAWIMLHYYL